jgi:hypothetical protein
LDSCIHVIIEVGKVNASYMQRVSYMLHTTMTIDSQKEMSSASPTTVTKIDLNDISSKSPHAIDLKKRDALKKLVKQNTKCEHTSIYSQISFICRRLAIAHEDNRITTEQSMNLIFEAHQQLSHKALPRDVVVEGLHKMLDKLEGNNRSLFGIVMANTNSSVHVKNKSSESIGKEDENREAGNRYSENYWADVI